MLALIQDPQIQKILNPPLTPSHWESDLKRLEAGDVTMNRHSAGENSIKALQRLLIFLGYSTSSGGSFSIDGDFGRGTNRALAQFEFDQGITNAKVSRKTLTYDCNWRSARSLIKSIPDVLLNINTLKKMLEVAKESISTNNVNCGNFDEAIFQLNALYNRTHLNCREINNKYGALAEKAVVDLKNINGRVIHPVWILSIIRQETAGVVRPRFEQHWLSKLAKQQPNVALSELRYQSMSFGLGQIMGFNFDRIGATSAKALYTAPLDLQVLSIARFLTRSSKVRPVVSNNNPSANDFKAVARYYNGSGFATHHYDESLARWLREFNVIRG